MKIKQDFVTNSSSTSYVVYIPENFDIDDWIRKKSELFEFHDEESPNQSIVKKIVEKLKHGEQVWQDDVDRSFNSYNFVYDLFQELGMILKDTDTSSESGRMINIGTCKIKQQMNKIEIENQTNIDIQQLDKQIELGEARPWIK